MPHRHRRGGRTTPRGPRPGHLRPVPAQAPPGPPVDAIIDGGARDVLDEGTALAAEVWASHLVGMFDAVRLEAWVGGEDDVPPFEQALLERCARRRDEPALVVATALAAVLPPPLEGEAARVAASVARSVRGPGWLADVGRYRATRAWAAGDAFGDQDVLIVDFALPGAEHDHGLVALVDHNLSGQAKDVWLGDDVDDVVAGWMSCGDPHLGVEEERVDSVLDRLGDAMAASDLWNGDTELRSEDFAGNRAMVWARLRAAGREPEARTGELAVPEPDRHALVADFLASAHGDAARSVLAGRDVELLVHHLVDLRSDYEGRPLRWSPIVVRLVLTDLAPRKLLLDPAQAAALPAVLRAFVRFAGDRTGLAPAYVEEVLAAVDECELEFLDRVDDPASAGPATMVLAGLEARGVPLDDPAAVAAALDQLEPSDLALPRPRRAPARAKAGDAPPQVVASAEQAPVLDRLNILADFYGDGRKLTQTGQPTLADARALVPLLGTEDRVDERIGERTFRTRSAAELPELGFTIRWAVAAGALRKEHGKLRATAAWRKLDGKPVQRWLKTADALLSLGPLGGYHPRALKGFRQMAQFVDELVPALLGAMRSAPLAFDAALDVVCAEADEAFVWTSGYWEDPEARRRSFQLDLDRLVRLLASAGIAERFGAASEPDRWDPERTRPVGGTLQLTPAGSWWVAQRRL